MIPGTGTQLFVYGTYVPYLKVGPTGYVSIMYLVLLLRTVIRTRYSHTKIKKRNVMCEHETSYGTVLYLYTSKISTRTVPVPGTVHIFVPYLLHFTREVEQQLMY